MPCPPPQPRRRGVEGEHPTLRVRSVLGAVGKMAHIFMCICLCVRVRADHSCDYEGEDDFGYTGEVDVHSNCAKTDELIEGIALCISLWCTTHSVQIWLKLSHPSAHSCTLLAPDALNKSTRDLHSTLTCVRSITPKLIASIACRTSLSNHPQAAPQLGLP